MYGTVARISGVQGRRADDLSLIVEGIRRFRIDRFTQMRPFFEAEVAYLDEEGE
jgi:ATP-dependent Lon protease